MSAVLSRRSRRRSRAFARAVGRKAAHEAGYGTAVARRLGRLWSAAENPRRDLA